MQCIVPAVVILLMCFYLWQNADGVSNRFQLAALGAIVFLFICAGFYVTLIGIQP